MKIRRILSVALLGALLLGNQTASAEGWSLAKLSPFGKKNSKVSERKKSETADRQRVEQPSPLKKLDVDTKKFFSKTKDAFSLKKTAVKPGGTRRPAWLHWPNPRRSSQPPKKQSSWFNSFFRRKEPEVPKSLDDWMTLERQDP